MFLSESLTKPAIFFDRDGVLTIPITINGKGFAPRKLSDFKVYEDALDSLKRTRFAGYLNIVVSNQPDVENGLLPLEILYEMNSKLIKLLSIDDILNCTHSSETGCSCRKPKAGMIFSAAKKHKIDLSISWLIGDRDSDIEAGTIVGLRTIFIERDWIGEIGFMANFKCKSLKEAVNIIIEQK